MQQTAAWIREQGGLEATRTFTRFWLALNGWWSWDDVPAMPPEVMLLPAWWPLNIYDFACWARQTYVALTIIRSHRPVRPAPFPIDELRTSESPPMDKSLFTWTGLFNHVDRLLRWYEKHPLRLLREAALSRAEAWIVRRQERDGSWGRYPAGVGQLDHCADAARLPAGPSGSCSRPWTDSTPSPSTTGIRDAWKLASRRYGTPAMAIEALNDSGTPSDDPRLIQAADWLLDQEIRVKGGLECPAPPPGARRLGVRVRQRQLPGH